jgi:serpin B
MKTIYTGRVLSGFLTLGFAVVVAIAAKSMMALPANSSGMPGQGLAPSLSFDRFGARFLASVIDESGTDTNVVFSPVSAGHTLSLALLGARGATAEALAQLLDLPSMDRRVLEQRGARSAALVARRTDVQLEIANAIWVDTSARLAPTFAASATRWNATVGTLALTSPEAVRTINRWADRATHGRIKELVDEPLPGESRLMITNAVYFKGKWADPFEAEATRPREFLLASGRRIQVPAMERTGRLAYQRTNGFQVVRLPYRGGRSAMYVILPDSGVSTLTLAKQFASKGWPTTLAKGAERDVHLMLPKFHVETTFDLRQPLEKLGAGVAFDPLRADFGDLAVARANGASLRLCIDRAEQKVFIDVSEEGTEGAAATGIVAVDTAAPPPPLNFIVDRPFLFLLRDEASGSDLFVGRIGRP